MFWAPHTEGSIASERSFSCSTSRAQASSPSRTAVAACDHAPTPRTSPDCTSRERCSCSRASGWCSTATGNGGARAASTPSELLRFGVPIAGAAILSGPLVNGLLPMMLSAWTGSAAVAFYGIALALPGIAGLPLGIFEQVLVPVWARMADRRTPGELARSYQQYATICFSFATGLAIVLLANDRAVLTLLFGPDYAAAGTALKYALLATLFAAWAGPNEAMLRATGLSRSILACRLITAVAGTASAAVLIPRHGLIGAVCAFALAVVVLNVVYGTALYRATRIHPFTVRHAITTLAAMAAVAAAIAVAG